jgi:hypothetical protein
MDSLQSSLDEVSRSNLRNLANALLPLNEWIRTRGPGDYEPPNASKLPWRHGGSLSVDQLGVIEFIDALLRESNSDITLLARWREVQADPLKYCPVDNKYEWRAARGLSAPSFGAVQSQNVLADNRGNQIVRSQFYASYLPALANATAKRNPADDAGWAAYALDLFKDTCAEWPASESMRSSRFMLQFLRDLLNAILGVRNLVPEPWRSAVLTEIGEFRRPGNKYTRQDVKRGLDEFISVLKSHRPAELKVSEVTEVLEIPTSAIERVKEPIEEPEIADAVKSHYLEW